MIYFVFIIGVIFGSFLNVVIYRLNPAPQLRGGVFGRSACLHCKTQLRWYDLIPILSFTYLCGKCRYCNKKISWQYPIVEILSGLIWVGIFYKSFGFQSIFNLQFLNSLNFFYYIFIFSILLIIAVYDYKWQIIPDKIIFPTIFIALIYNLFQSPNIEIFLWLLLTAIAAFLFFFSIYFFSKGRAMGFGDAKLAFLIGLLLNTILSITAFILAFIIGAVFGIILLIFTDKTLKSQIAFGPFLIIGMTISFFLSDFIFRFFY